MPSRQCIICPLPAVAGRSRCSTHGRSTPKGPRYHDATHTRLAKLVVQQAIADGTYCAICGLPPTPDDPLEGGHIVPRVLGGQNVIENYRAEHRSHNRAEGARLAQARRRFFPSR